MWMQFVGIKIKSGSIIAAAIVLTMFAGFCTSCTASINSSKITQTADYSISAPSEWIIKPAVVNSPKDSPNINIISNGKSIGGIDILSYDSTKPIEQLFGNHVSRVIKIDKIKTSKVPAVRVILERDWQTDKQRFVQYELHVYFMPGKSAAKYGEEIVYDFSLNSGQINVGNNPEMMGLNENMAAEKIFDSAGINENQLNKIIKSFILKDWSGAIHIS